MSDLKILMVEDENIDAMDIKETLESFGYKVPYVASRGEEAIEKIFDLRPDMVLIDIALKGNIDGIEVAHRIKELDIPFIFITALADEATIENAMETEPSGYLIKPFDDNKLKLTVEHGIYKKKMEIETSKQVSITTAINRVLQEALTCESDYDVARICLEVAEELTESAIGFIGEVNHAGLFDTIAVSDPGWDECVIPETNAVNLIVDMEIRGYWARAIKTGKSVIVNDPLSDPGRLGEPEGHPLITSFLGVPLKQADKTIGMIALANKKSGYTKEDAEAIETLSVAFLEALFRKKTEMTLQKSEERFRAVAESAVDAIVTTDLDGVIRFFNKSLQDIFGYSHDELTGKSLTTLMPERFKGNYLGELENFKKSGYHRLIGKTVKTTGLKKDGTEFPFEMSLASWKSGDNIFFTSIIRDLTEKHKAEEELKWSEERLKMGMDMAKLVYWEYDIASDMFTFDDHFYSLYGTSVEEEGSNKMSSQEYSTRFVPEEERELVGEEVAKAIETEDPDFTSTLEHSIIRADGKRRNIIVRIAVRLDENGQKIGTRGVNQDITELKMAEDALKESDRRLADIIEFLPDATFAIDKMGRVIFWNQAIEEMTGVRSEEILGRGNYEYALPFYGMRRPILIDMVKSADDDVYKHYKKPRRKGNILTAETEASLRGVIKTVWGKAVPLYDSKGNFAGAIEAIRDITEMKESRMKIRRELEINKSLANIYAPLVSPSSTIEDVANAILGEARKLTASPYGFVSNINPDNVNHTLVMMLPDSEDTHEEGLTFNLSPDANGEYPGIYGHILNTDKALFTNSPNEHPVYTGIPQGHLEIQRFLSVPVILGDELVGQITLVNAPDDYNDDDLDAIKRLAVFYGLAIQNKRAEQEIKQSLNDKELLLREVHHRVKNNMQIISSLLNLQMQHVSEEQSQNVLRESQGRIKSMAMVHEKLYQSPSFTLIDFKDYVEKLVSDIVFSYGVSSKINIDLDIEDIHMGIDTAIPCGLIINELVTNSVKYAFPNPDNKGILKVKLKSLKDQMELVIADDGRGLPEDLDISQLETLGLQLVTNLVTQIDGKITLDTSNGTKFTIVFKELQYKKRI